MLYHRKGSFTNVRFSWHIKKNILHVICTPLPTSRHSLKPKKYPKPSQPQAQRMPKLPLFKLDSADK